MDTFSLNPSSNKESPSPGFELPVDIWFHIASFIPFSMYRQYKLYTVNRKLLEFYLREKPKFVEIFFTCDFFKTSSREILEEYISDLNGNNSRAYITKSLVISFRQHKRRYTANKIPAEAYSIYLKHKEQLLDYFAERDVTALCPPRAYRARPSFLRHSPTRSSLRNGKLAKGKNAIRLFGKLKIENEETSIKYIKTVYDMGIITFDTPDSYSNGQSEVVIGKAIKEHNFPPNGIVMMTKVFFAVACDIKTTLVDIKDPDNEGYVNQRDLSRNTFSTL
ncbi:Versiconal hemiacetal acetate reductase [Leucoagaricus sp. SymC.cos]|nr:Versiconal hemiacetal acetate reductase [Leucoagaricus sp. SymC.cos]